MPKVTVLTPTYNRVDYLKDTILSVVNQSEPDWEMLVINDGGEDVQSIIDEIDDPRVRYFHRKSNRGKASCLNFALEKARGQYIAYLDDDDIWYPNHLSVLSRALDENPGIGVVYSDLYAVQFIKDEATGKRIPLHKFIQVSRDYNRDFMFYFNHVLHVSLMHRKELAFKVGGYDESIRVLIDWNISRKLSFFTDFKYIPVLTGEYYMPISQSDRISVMQRQDDEAFRHNKRRVKADFPPAPWPKVDRITVVFPVFEWTDAMVHKITELIDVISYPVRYIIVNATGVSERQCRSKLDKIGRLKNITIVTPGKPTGELGAYRYGVKKAAADVVYLPSMHVDTKLPVRLIAARRFMRKNRCKVVKWPMKKEQQSPYDILVDKKHFLRISHPKNRHATTDAMVMPAGLPESLECDIMAHMAETHYQNGEFHEAYELVTLAERVGKGGAGKQVLVDLFARVCFELGRYDEAENMCRNLIQKGYGADNWIRMGWILQRKGRLEEAIESFQKGLEGIELNESELSNPIFPICVDIDFGAFSALIGIGECLLDLGRLTEAARMFRLASKLKANSHRPFLGFAQMFLKTNDLEQAEMALNAAAARAGQDPDILLQFGCLLEKRYKHAEAFELFVRIYGMDKTDPRVIDALYRVGTRLGRWQEIRQILESHLGDRPFDHEIKERLLEIYREMGEHEKARMLTEQLQASISLEKPQREEAIQWDRRFRSPSTLIRDAGVAGDPSRIIGSGGTVSAGHGAA